MCSLCMQQNADSFTFLCLFGVKKRTVHQTQFKDFPLTTNLEEECVIKKGCAAGFSCVLYFHNGPSLENLKPDA